jgi:hypothetical protein
MPDHNPCVDRHRTGFFTRHTRFGFRFQVSVCRQLRRKEPPLPIGRHVTILEQFM